MRRWIAFITLMLLLGAVTTVLVAWVAAGTHSIWYRGETLFDSSRNELATETVTGWSRYAFERSFATTMVWLEPGANAYEMPELYTVSPSGAETPAWDGSWTRCEGDHTVVHQSHGWPLRSMLTTAVTPSPEGNHWDATVRRHSIALVAGIPITSLSYGLFERDLFQRSDAELIALWPFSMDEGFTTALPLYPILPGFLLDTLLFSAVWFVFLLGRTMLQSARSNLQRRRLRCPWCGHRQSPDSRARCAECGKPPTPMALRPSKAAFIGAIVITILIALGALALAAGLHSTLRAYDDPLEWAVWRGDLEAVNSLLDEEAVATKDGQATPCDCSACGALRHAAYYGRLEIVLALLDRGIAATCGSEYASLPPSTTSSLERAIDGGHREVIELLLDRIEFEASPAESYAQRKFARDILLEGLNLALTHGDAATTRSIVERAPRWRLGHDALTADQRADLFLCAAQGGSAEAMRRMLEWRGRAVESSSEESNALQWRATELHNALVVAARWRRHEIVELLLSEGAFDRATEKQHDSVLMAAILSGDATMVRRILDAGAAPDSKTLHSITIAIAFGHHDVATLLVERGADPNRSHEEYFGTPIMAAKELGLPDSSIRLLRKLGATDN